MSRFRSAKLLASANGQACVLCGDDTPGMVVSCHLPGVSYGMPGGMGSKTHDWLTAELCHSCHDRLDGHWRGDIEVRMRVLCLTLERRFNDGVIIVA